MNRFYILPNFLKKNFLTIELILNLKVALDWAHQDPKSVFKGISPGLTHRDKTHRNLGTYGYMGIET